MVENAGWRKFLTTNLSVMRDKIESTDMGRMSEGAAGEGTFGTGWITAVFHWLGTLECDKDKLIGYAKRADNIGAAVRTNHEGMLSGPEAVGCNLSSNSKTSNSETCLLYRQGVCLSGGLT